MKGGEEIRNLSCFTGQIPATQEFIRSRGTPKEKICDNSIQFNPFHFGYSLNELKRKGAREILLSPNPLIGYI
jgi:hypothetical protein